MIRPQAARILVGKITTKLGVLGPKLEKPAWGRVALGAWCSTARRTGGRKQTTDRLVVTCGHAHNPYRDSSEAGPDGGEGRTDAAVVPVATTGPSGARAALLRQLEVAAEIAGELESLLSLGGPDSARSPDAEQVEIIPRR